MKYVFNSCRATIIALNLLLAIIMSNCSSMSSTVPSVISPESESAVPVTTSKPPPFKATELAPTATSTSAQTVIHPVERQCLQSAESPIPEIEGQLILAGYRLEGFSSWIDGQSYLYNLQNDNQILLGTTQYETVSPNGDLFAYYEKSSDTVVILENEGNRIMELPADHANLFPAYWIDDQRLLLNKGLGISTKGDIPSLFILNPFTNEQEWLFPDYPEQDRDYYYYDWRVTSNLIFNPKLNRVVYPFVLDNQTGLMLRDIDTDREITRIYNGAPRGNTPQWSPDGNYFIINAPIRGSNQSKFMNINDDLPYVGGSDLLLVGLNGQIKRLTYFTVSTLARESNYVWSPDGRKIAFLQMDLSNSYEPSLMVLDINKGIITDYCQLAEPPLDANNIPVSLADPVWSPDGKYLVFTEINEEYQYKVRLLELESGKTWEIAEGVSVMGWMTSP